VASVDPGDLSIVLKNSLTTLPFFAIIIVGLAEPVAQLGRAVAFSAFPGELRKSLKIMQLPIFMSDVSPKLAKRAVLIVSIYLEEFAHQNIVW
jgi:hypothetical protein